MIVCLRNSDAAPRGQSHDHDDLAGRTNPAFSRAASLPDTPPGATEQPLHIHLAQRLIRAHGHVGGAHASREISFARALLTSEAAQQTAAGGAVGYRLSIYPSASESFHVQLVHGKRAKLL
jgi:hypothetical protein